MTTELRGKLNGDELSIGIAVSRFNHFVTDKLLDGAKEGLVQHGVSEDRITIAQVPGSFELPLTIRRLAETGRFDALIAIGAVIRGETDHYEHVGGEAARGVANASVATGVPVIFAVLTTDTVEQATDRAGGKRGNSGYTAAVSAIEMANLMRQIADAP